MLGKFARDRAGRGVDQVVDALQGAGSDERGVGAVVGGHGQRLARPDLPPDVLDRVLGQHEDNGDRLGLGQNHQAGRARRLHVVAWIDQPEANPSGDRGDDVAIDEIELRSLDVRLVLLDGAFVLLDEELLVSDLLLGDAVLLAQSLVSGEVRLRLVEQALVVDERPFRQVERRLMGTRIDLGEKVALMDNLAFLEADFGQLPADLGLDGNRRQRGHGSQAGERIVDIPHDGLGCAYRLGF